MSNDITEQYENFQMDFTNVESGNYISKAGVYKTKITKAETKINKNNVPQVIVTFETEDKKTISEFCPIDPNDNASFKTKRLMSTLEISDNLSLGMFVNSLPGNYVELVIVDNEYQGQINQQIKSMTLIKKRVEQPQQQQPQQQQPQQQQMQASPKDLVADVQDDELPF